MRRWWQSGAGVVVMLLAVLVGTGCESDPVSGKYCPAKADDGECLLVDLEGSKVTFLLPDDERLEVKCDCNKSACEKIESGKGKFAGKMVSFRFNHNHPNKAEMSHGGLQWPVQYVLQ